MTTPAAPQRALELLISCYSLAISGKFGADADPLLQLIATCRPRQPEVRSAQILQLLQARDHHAAHAALLACEADNISSPMISALFACCLFMKNDGLWNAYADAAVAGEHDDTVAEIVRALRKSPRERDAAKTAGAPMPAGEFFGTYSGGPC